MKRTVQVHIGETPRLVGLLHYNREGGRESAIFEYDASWLAAPDGFAIDPALPLQPGPQFHPRAEHGSVFHSAIADTAPDGWGQNVIRRDHAKRRAAARAAGGAVPPIEGDLDYLLEVDDSSRVGALRFRDEDGVFQRAGIRGRRSIPPLIELERLLVATRAVETHTETAADLAYLRGRGSSLGGMRPKCTIVDEEGRLSIGKFPSVRDERAVTKGEVLALRLADDAGIRAAKAALVMSRDTPVAVIRRFDRIGDNDRILYVSAATLLGVSSGDPAPHTYTEIADALRTYGAATQADIDELWRRMALSILITNVDDHLHNHGFLHVEHGKWRLSPAFDVNPFPDRERELKTWISEEAGPAATIEGLMSVAPYFAIRPAAARTILREVESAVAQWRAVGQDIGMTSQELDQFADAFEHPERESARSHGWRRSGRG
jgi:serine/threonine-protein kinase HipA